MICGQCVNKIMSVTLNLDFGTQCLWMAWLRCHFETHLQTLYLNGMNALTKLAGDVKLFVQMWWWGDRFWQPFKRDLQEDLRSVHHRDIHNVVPYYRQISGKRMKNKTLLYTHAFKGTKMHSQQRQMMWNISSIWKFEAATIFTGNTKVAASPCDW